MSVRKIKKLKVAVGLSILVVMLCAVCLSLSAEYDKTTVAFLFIAVLSLASLFCIVTEIYDSASFSCFISAKQIEVSTTEGAERSTEVISIDDIAEIKRDLCSTRIGQFCSYTLVFRDGQQILWPSQLNDQIEGIIEQLQSRQPAADGDGEVTICGSLRKKGDR